MAWLEIPLDTTPDCEFSINVNVDGKSVPLIMRTRYNTEGKFWKLDISDGITGDMLISNAPLVTGQRIAANFLRQFAHFDIGEAIVLKVTDGADGDIPDPGNLGTDFLLVWGSETVG